ncbi:MAG: DUF1963 domain-containing protein [Planctomycetaceae bacterium]|nr:DUF1963 domain-containing protein [Planctomycetaceae bacterium]
MPKLTEVAADLDRLLEYAGVFTDWKVADALTAHPPEALLAGLISRRQRTANDWFIRRYHTLCNEVLGRRAEEWIRSELREAVTAEQKLAVLKDAWNCLPETEALTAAFSALKSCPLDSRVCNAIFLASLREPRVLDWMEEVVPDLGGSTWDDVASLDDETWGDDRGSAGAMWGDLAAASAFDWARAEKWLAAGPPLSLVALYALNACHSPNVWRVVQEINPHLSAPPTFEQAKATLREYVTADPNPRTERLAKDILDNWDIVTWDSPKRVPAGSPGAFRKKLSEQKKPTRQIIVGPANEGCEPVTKISGAPWWPADLPRPTCEHGHTMAFMAQIRLSDVPGFETHKDSLVSFHYCSRCAYDGNMSWGTQGSNESGCDVSVITEVAARDPDRRGVVAEGTIDPHSVSFRDVMEVPGFEDTMAMYSGVPDDYPQGTDDFDENIYPGLIHVKASKVGGWPSWVNSPRPPAVEPDEQLYFIGQLDWMLGEQTAWGGGGYAYLFLISSDTGALRGALIVDTT